VLYKTILQQGVEILKTKNYISESTYNSLTEVVSNISKKSFRTLNIDNFKEQVLDTNISFDRVSRKIKTSPTATFPAVVDTAIQDIGNATLRSVFVVGVDKRASVEILMSYDNISWFTFDPENINIVVEKEKGFYLRVKFNTEANFFKELVLCFESEF